MIFDMDGTAISSNYSEYPCTFPQTGWVEQDGNMTWQCTCETSKKAIEKFDDVRKAMDLSVSNKAEIVKAVLSLR